MGRAERESRCVRARPRAHHHTDSCWRRGGMVHTLLELLLLQKSSLRLVAVEKQHVPRSHTYRGLGPRANKSPSAPSNSFFEYWTNLFTAWGARRIIAGWNSTVPSATSSPEQPSEVGVGRVPLQWVAVGWLGGWVLLRVGWTLKWAPADVQWRSLSHQGRQQQPWASMSWLNAQK